MNSISLIAFAGLESNRPSRFSLPLATCRAYGGFSSFWRKIGSWLGLLSVLFNYALDFLFLSFAFFGVVAVKVLSLFFKTTKSNFVSSRVNSNLTGMAVSPCFASFTHVPLTFPYLAGFGALGFSHLNCHNVIGLFKPFGEKK